MLLLILLASAFMLSAAMTYALRLYALRVNLLDVPNARSSHARPTPRGGGIAIVIIVLVVSVFAPLLTDRPALLPPFALLGLTAVAAIGYWDDHSHVPAQWRLAVHALAAALILYSLSGLPAVPWWGGVIEPGLAGAILAGVGLVWLINLYNFMDGIDGIAAVEALTVLLAAMALLLAEGRALPLELPLIAAAVAGFLVWNWPPASIFMGDAASGFLGALLGAIALVISSETSMNPWCWLILLGVFITDATMTLLRRMVRGERWYEAHRSHAYQRLSHRIGRHWPVTIGVAAINWLWLAPLAWATARLPAVALFITLLAYLPLVLVGWWSGAGLPDDQ
ncbi:MAG TPA: glycosyltransferase family 4 protein [Nitrococcus sp.]|nr:glycosyltransferase family 4 protein [Nitrococcus sp.]